MEPSVYYSFLVFHIYLSHPPTSYAFKESTIVKNMVNEIVSQLKVYLLQHFHQPQTTTFSPLHDHLLMSLQLLQEDKYT